MRKNQVQLIKVSCVAAVSLAAILAFAYSWYLRTSGMGAVLASEGELERKSVEYGMCRTKADLAKVGDIEIDPVAEGIFLKAARKCESNYQLGYAPVTYRIDNSDQVHPPYYLDSEIKVFLPRTEAFLKVCLPLLKQGQIRRSRIPFDLHHYFIDDKVNPEYALGLDKLSTSEKIVLGKAVLAAQQGHEEEAITHIRLETKIRKLGNISHRFLGIIHQVKARTEAAPSLLVILQYFPHPSSKLVAAIRESQQNDRSVDFQTFCRILFYYGSDGFPDGEEYRVLKPSLGDRYGKYTLLPRIRKTWMLFIQASAIKAFEANRAAGGGLNGAEAGMEAISSSLFGCDELFFEARMSLPQDLYMTDNYGGRFKERLAAKLKAFKN